MTTKKKKKFRFASLFYIFSAIFLTCFFIGAGVGIYYIANVLQDVPELDLSRLESTQSSQIYDQNNELIVDLGLQSRENISYIDLPQSLIDSFVAIEDSRFFDHNGFDLVRFIKAALVNIRTGDFSQGGSTFTMQMIKNSFFTTTTSLAEKSIPRKIKEIYLSIQVENVLTKEQILEHYLNKICFGANNYGVQKGAEYYFGKDVSEINLSEAALLAGVVNAPFDYNPYLNLELATKRRDVVLNLMVYHGYISAQEARLASAIKIEDLLIGEGNDTDAFPYQAYIDAVAEECEQLTGKNPYETPMIVHTYMNREAQEKAESILKGEKVKYPEKDELLQAAFSVIENDTGHIIALGGGRNYNGQRQFNRATNMYRQPGSTAKPILAYSLAFDHLGWATSHVVEDKPIVYRGTGILLPNADSKYLGEITLVEALQRSRNTSAMLTYEQLYDKLGRNFLVDHIKNLGFNTTTDTFELGYVIGSSNFSVSPTQLASAYSVFANEGDHINPTTIRRIEFLDDSAPIDPQYLPINVISPESAYMVSYLLEKDVDSPYYNYMQILKNNNFKVYSKTGTTDYGDEAKEYGIPVGAIKDKWNVSMTSEYTVAVWVGYDKPVKGGNTYFNNAKNVLNIPVTIAKEMLFSLHKDNYPAPIARPSSVENINHIIGTFPYAVSDLADDSVMTSGYIKKEFNNLVTLSPTPVSNMDSFSAYMQQETNSLIFSFADYPDPNRVSSATNTKIFELTYIDSKTKQEKTVKAEGALIYDSKRYFGNVQYKVDLVVDGNTFTTFTASHPRFLVYIPEVYGSNVEVCGYYGLSLASAIQSNRKCLNMYNLSYDIPEFDDLQNGTSHNDNTTPPTTPDQEEESNPDEYPENPDIDIPFE